MQLRYSFRLYPSAGQRVALARAFGCARVVYNDALRARETARARGLPFPKAGELSRLLITEAKKTPERAWLGEVSAVVLQQSLRDLDTAYRNFFEGLSAEKALPDAPTEIGVDLGLTHFAVLSDSTKIGSPRFLRRAEKRLKKAQRALSRKEKGSKNRGRARLRVARVHARVADARREFHHQLSTKLIRENQAVAVSLRPPDWRCQPVERR